MTTWFYTVNSVDGDVTATQGAEASTAMMLTKFSENILFPSPETDNDAKT